MKRSTTFADLLRESVISQLLLTVMVVGGYIVIYIVKGTVPELMSNMTILIVGFFFGAKVTNQMANALGGDRHGRTSTDSRTVTDSTRSVRSD